MHPSRKRVNPFSFRARGAIANITEIAFSLSFCPDSTSGKLDWLDHRMIELYLDKAQTFFKLFKLS